MQHSAETVKMEETHTGSMDDTANLKVDEDLLMDKSGESIRDRIISLLLVTLHWLYYVLLPANQSRIICLLAEPGSTACSLIAVTLPYWNIVSPLSTTTTIVN